MPMPPPVPVTPPLPSPAPPVPVAPPLPIATPPVPIAPPLPVPMAPPLPVAEPPLPLVAPPLPLVAPPSPGCRRSPGSCPPCRSRPRSRSRRRYRQLNRRCRSRRCHPSPNRRPRRPNRTNRPRSRRWQQRRPPATRRESASCEQQTTERTSLSTSPSRWGSGAAIEADASRGHLCGSIFREKSYSLIVIHDGARSAVFGRPRSGSGAGARTGLRITPSRGAPGGRPETGRPGRRRGFETE